MRRLAAYPKRPRNEGQGLCSEVTLSVPAYADITTMQMMSLCEPVVNAVPLPDGNTRSVHTYESGLCWGAFLALESLSFDYVNQGDSESILGICPPMTGSSAQTIVQMVRIFDNYARQHPEIQHQKFELTALAALKPVYPCK